MTQEQAIQRGFTHFIEVFRSKSYREGVSLTVRSGIEELDNTLLGTKCSQNLYTVAIFLIKPKLK